MTKSFLTKGIFCVFLSIFPAQAQTLHLPAIGLPPTTGVALPFRLPQPPMPVTYNTKTPAKRNKIVNGNVITSNTYQIQSGDTLSAIALRADITLSELLANNPNLNEKSVILPGQTLNITNPQITNSGNDMGGGKKIAATLSNNWQIGETTLSPTLCGHINCTRSSNGLISEDGTHIWGDSVQLNLEKQINTPEQLATWPELSRLTLHPDSLELNAIALAFNYCNRSKPLTTRISCTRQGNWLKLTLKP